jgi:DNA-binding MarR family transcriptional regulator
MSTIEINCAEEILEVVPAVMRAIRSEMRKNRGADLSIPQFRALIFVRRKSGASLSEVADHLGLTLPSTSALIEGLVQRGLVSRRPVEQNRRQIQLELTEMGRPLLEDAIRHSRDSIAKRLTVLSDAERETIGRSMELLRTVFQS